jgi:5-methylcytosine-specific restriction endonuclease McrA
MFDVLVRGLGFSSSAAFRRIEAAKVLLAVPKAVEKFESGELNLTTLAKAQTLMKAQEKVTGQRLTREFKEQVIEAIENKSSEDAERELIQLMPDCKVEVHKERRMILDEETTRHSLNFSKKMSADLKRAKEVFSHKFPNASDAEIIGYALAFLLEKADPLRVNEKVETVTQTHAKLQKKENKPTAAAAAGRVKRLLIKNAGASCTYKDPKSGRVCGSKYQVQIDHIIPRVLGGTDEPSNLRVLCRVHNFMMAERFLGRRHMSKFRRAGFLLPRNSGGSNAKGPQNQRTKFQKSQ